MTSKTREPKDIVLVGGGHAHLYALLRTHDLVRRGYRVTLVDPSLHLRYSGMATGEISGDYPEDANRIDLRRLVERGGGRFVQDRVADIRAEDRATILGSGEMLPYDAASVCLGSETLEDVPANAPPDAVRVKPISGTREIKYRLLSLAAGDTAPRVLVVGGGAAGCEVAANTLALLESLNVRGEVTIAERGGSLLPDAPKRAQKVIHAFLSDRGVRVLTNTPISSFDGGVARAPNGREVIPYDLPVLAVGVAPPGEIFRASNLPTGDCGGLWVDRNLRAIAGGPLFGGGDCVSYRGRGLPRLGVFAVRQGPVILHNLRAALEDKPLKPYKPQRHYLYVLNLGDGTGLAIYGPLALRGRLAHQLKRRIDEKFVGGFQ